MNSLNQIIIEGSLVEDATEIGGIISFNIETVRNYKDAYGSVCVEKSNFNVIMYCDTSKFTKYLKKGKQVRIVGRLASSDTGVSIVAEHIDLRGYV